MTGPHRTVSQDFELHALNLTSNRWERIDDDDNNADKADFGMYNCEPYSTDHRNVLYMVSFACNRGLRLQNAPGQSDHTTRLPDMPARRGSMDC